VPFPNRLLPKQRYFRNRRREPAGNCYARTWPQIKGRALSLLLLAACSFLLQPAFSATTLPPYTAVLAWDRSPDDSVTGYRVYYGTSPRNYTNSIVAGNILNTTISGLTSGMTYYFAVTAYDASGAESDFSNEVAVMPGQPQLRLGVTPAKQAALTVSGLIGHTYEILASTNLTTWSVIGSATLGPGATQDFTDPDAASFPRRFYRTRDTAPAPVNPAPAGATVVIRSSTAQQTVVTVTGLPGHTYDPQVSMDLTSWTSLGQVTLGTSGSQDILDQVTPYRATRFYRAPHVGP
jgi:hypothetical protein